MRIAQLLLVAAILLSSWLTYDSITSSIGCGEGGDCSSVITSPWAKLLGIPVALLGLFTYINILTLTFCRPFQSRSTASIVSTFCLLIIGSALWFTALQAIIIKSFCPYCCAIHALASIASIILLAQIFSKYRGSSPLPTILPILVSFSIVAGMVLIQFITPSPTRSIITSTENHKHGADSTPLLFSIGERGKPIFHNETTVQDSLGTIKIGSKTGEIITLGYLYDWTCEYCVALHQHLTELVNTPEELSNRYHISLLPYSHTEAGREIHRQLAFLKQADPTNHEIIELELHNQILEASAESIRNRVKELSPNFTSHINNIDGVKIAEQQLQHNQTTLHLTTVPQLFGIYSALTGNPTKEELLSFLEKAAREQSQYSLQK